MTFSKKFKIKKYPKIPKNKNNQTFKKSYKEASYDNSLENKL